MNMKIAFFTFGCTVNNYETQKMRELFEEKGDQITETGDADVYIINSCAITGSAEKGALQLIARLKKKNPNSILALVGCYGENLKKNGKAEVPGVDIILDNKKFSIVDEVYSFASQNKNWIPKTSPVARVRAFDCPRTLLQVQNGCDNRCTYCVVPHLRGNSVSKPYDEFIKEIHEAARLGYKEVVLAGLNLGFYADQSYTLIDVLKAANSLDSIKSIRLSSLEPMNVGDSFINELPLITKLSPHLHISLQSGCDRILSKMNRKYTFAEYYSMITKIRGKIPGIAITTDIIVGFPGESEEDFEESLNNIIRCQFSDIHIFKYSQRAQTPAAAMKNQITEHQKIRRSLLLKGIKMQSRYNFNNTFINQTEKITPLKQGADGLCEGVTAHNVRVLIKLDGIAQKDILDGKITGVSDDYESLYAEMI